MNTHRDPRELAVELLGHSPCTKVLVAAVLSDYSGIFSWGTNHDVVHAEEEAIRNSDQHRLRGARLTVAGRRKKSGNWVLARPCEKNRRQRPDDPPCFELARRSGISIVEFITKSGEWSEVVLE